jgi:hypothetical protein
MMTALPNPDSAHAQADDDRPCFLDDRYDASSDDLGDWWLDLGGVALPG